MAQILPVLTEDPLSSGISPAEWLTLNKLQAGLPPDWLVFHNIRWTQARDFVTHVGEIDFCVLSPGGRVVVIEQKNGELIEKPDGIFKHYPNGPKNVGTQIQRTLDGLHSKFKRFHPEGGFRADYLIYLPDYQVRHINAIALDPERIVDSSRSEQLCSIIMTLLRDDPEKPANGRFEKVRDFLLDTYELVRDVHAFGKLQGDIYRKISGGLTTWVNRLSFEPFHLRVTGTAGCGKTQLAMNELKKTVDAGKKALMICFNHSLAAKLSAITPEGAKISTFHRLCDDWMKSAGQAVDHNQGASIFEQMVESALRLPVPAGWPVDTLVIDEGQDMHQVWADLLQRLVKPNGRIVWIEDPNQRLYDIEPVLLSDFVKLDVPTNYRSPGKIQQVIELLLDLGTESGNPFPGMDPEFHTYDSNQTLFRLVRERIGLLLSQGFRKENIAVISFRGFKNSAFANLDQLGQYTLKRFTGAYDENGHQISQDGDILFDTIYRYKGQQAQVILFVEIDFEALDELTRNKLYCGMTRATAHLECFFSNRASDLLSQNLHSESLA